MGQMLPKNPRENLGGFCISEPLSGFEPLTTSFTCTSTSHKAYMRVRLYLERI